MKRSRATSILGALAITVLAPLAVIGLDGIDKPYDWTIEIKTEQLERQFEYEGSTLKPVCKTQVKYFSVASEDDKKYYEDMWFHNGKALGLERQRKFDVSQGDGVAIKVLHKTDSPQPDEFKAAANAVSRLYLDAYLNKNPIVTVIAKDVFFNQVSNALLEQGWEVLEESPDTPLDAQIILHLNSESGDLSKSLTYPSH